MRFVKMQGIGNDYVYVDMFNQHVEQPEKLAVKVADRHFGIGGDGLILVAPPTAGEGTRGDGAHADVQCGWERVGDVRERGAVRGEVCV